MELGSLILLLAQKQSILQPKVSIKSACLQKQSSQKMATPKKAIPPKKTKETKKPSSKKKDNNNIKKTSNGSVAAVRSPSAKSQKIREQNGGKSTKTPTPKSNKGKRVRDEEVEEKEDVKSYTFPMERVKRIIRAEDSELRISSDAVFLVNKATEKFLEKFSEDAHKCCVKDRKKAIAYKHLSSVVCKQKRYDFLSDFVPEKVKAKDALAKRKQSEAGTS